jgi:hypothetical protein
MCEQAGRDLWLEGFSSLGIESAQTPFDKLVAIVAHFQPVSKRVFLFVTGAEESLYSPKA